MVKKIDDNTIILVTLAGALAGSMWLKQFELSKMIITGMIGFYVGSAKNNNEQIKSDE